MALDSTITLDPTQDGDDLDELTQIELASFAVGWDIGCQASGNPDVDIAPELPDCYDDYELNDGYDAAMAATGAEVLEV